MGACGAKQNNQSCDRSQQYEHSNDKDKQNEGLSDPADIGSSSAVAAAIPSILEVVTPLIAEIEESYQNGGFKRAFYCVNSSLVRFVRILHAEPLPVVTYNCSSSMFQKLWIPEITFMEKTSAWVHIPFLHSHACNGIAYLVISAYKSEWCFETELATCCRILWGGDFSAEDSTEMIRQILLYSKNYAAHNPRKGLLYRLTTTHLDAHETMVESFAEIITLLKEETLNNLWGTMVRGHMTKLQCMFDMYTRQQQEVRFA